jgi:hypothetical protein
MKHSLILTVLSAIAILGILVSAYGDTGGGKGQCCASNDVDCAGCRLVGNNGKTNLYVQISETNAFNRCVPSKTKTDNCTNDTPLKACYTSKGVKVQLYTENTCNKKDGMAPGEIRFTMCTCGAANSQCGCK